MTNLRTLKYLIAVVDHQHFGKAADACFVSQPTLSMQLKKLEDNLGIQLIERKNKKIFITPLARQVADHGRRILYEIDQLKKMTHYFLDPFAAEITLGILPTIAPYLLPAIMPNIHKQFPKLQLHMQEDTTKRLKERLTLGELDIILLAEAPQPEEDMEHLVLYEEPFQVVLPMGHSLLAKQKISIEELNKENLLLLTEEHCLRQQIWHFCQTANSSISNQFRATSLETIKQLVAAGYGITLMPKLACLKNEQKIQYREFVPPVPYRTITLVWRKSAIQKTLYEHLAKTIQTSL